MSRTKLTNAGVKTELWQQRTTEEWHANRASVARYRFKMAWDNIDRSLLYLLDSVDAHNDAAQYEQAAEVFKAYEALVRWKQDYLFAGAVEKPEEVKSNVTDSSELLDPAGE